MSGKTHLTPSPEVIAVLKEADVTDTQVVLNGQLTPTLYKNVNKVLEMLGGKWNRSAKAHLFKESPVKVIEEICNGGKVANEKVINQAFYTPEDTALTLAKLLPVQYGQTILEPNVGGGALLEAVWKVHKDKNYSMIAYDVAPKTDPSIKVIIQDFLTTDFSTFDHVIMNPPFSNNAFIHHIQHAYKKLAVGGTLISIVPSNWNSVNNTKVQQQWNNWIKELDRQGNLFAKDLPEGTFKESGTNIATSYIILTKGAF
jgi:type I restriction-modification system DNA methylase subunit